MDVLASLGIQPVNSGASTGPHWWSSSRANEIIVLNPSTAQPLASVMTATASDLKTIIRTADNTFRLWRLIPAPKRGEVIRNIADELRQYKDPLGTLVAMETGKLKQEGDGEVQEMIDMADFAVGLSRMLYGKTMPSERPRHRMMEQWHPLGPIGVITAFNFPVAVWAWNALIAAVCGDCVIWKPSHKVPLSAIAVQHICNRVLEKMGYDGIFSLFITDDRSLAEEMVAEKRLPLISFTGSIPAGRRVAEIVTHRIGRTILELSGNNAVIIDEFADLNLAVPTIVFGAIGTAGQRCTTTRRVIVHQSRYKELTEQLIFAYRQITIGDPLSKNVLMGPLIDQRAVDNYVAAIKTLKKRGGEILYGGRVIDRPGFFVEPTLVRAKNEWDIVQQETFGPILYIMTYDNLEEAVTLQNEVRQGLSSALFTDNLQHAEYFLSMSDCGIANINVGTSGAEIGGAFGGEKETGGGREAGSDAWKSYMRRQTNTINWSRELPLAQNIQFHIRPK